MLRLSEAEETLRAIGAGEVDGFVVSNGDAGRRVVMLSSDDRPYQMFVESMREGAATLSGRGVLLYANSRLADLLRRPPESIVGTALARFVAVRSRADLEDIRCPGGLGATVELELLDADGTAVPVLVGSSPLDVGGERLTCLTFTDLTAQKAQDREIARLGRAQSERLADLQAAQVALTRQATHDSLTGLPNRALLVDRIDQALSLSKRSGSCTAVLFLDLDRFKFVNDTRGHAAGDGVLRDVAARLATALRPMDTVARVGGDEFVVLAPEVGSLLSAVDLSTWLIALLGDGTDRSDDAESVAVSVGISVSVGGRGTAEVLLDEADKAMYHAKSLGGARVGIFDAALGRQVQQRALARRLLQADLDDRRLIAHYQPVVDVRSGRVVGFEALARIVREDGSILPPAAFIPVAEESGLVIALGEQMLTMACGEAWRWHPAGGSGAPPTVAVNVSARQFEPGDLPVIVGDTLERTGLDPGRLHLELTETTIIDLRPDIVRQLVRIRDLGVEIGLDDFGTGYASLTHLRRLPLTFVKIDQSFVQGLQTDMGDERIVAAVVDLAANLGLRSIAEGVETGVQLSRLRELGCDQAQGYLLARPMPADEVPGAMDDAA